MKKVFTVLVVGMLISGMLIGCGNASNATATNESVIVAEEPEPTDPPVVAVTTEPTETQTTEPEATETPEPEETSTEEPEPSEAPEATEAPAYTYTDMSKTMYAQSSVNVRDLPSTDGNKLGGLNTNDEVQVTGQCNETSWYRFEYNGSVAYVSNKYLGDNKVEVTANTTGTTSSSGQQIVEAYGYKIIIEANGNYAYYRGNSDMSDGGGTVAIAWNYPIHEVIDRSNGSDYDLNIQYCFYATDSEETIQEARMKALNYYLEKAAAKGEYAMNYVEFGPTCEGVYTDGIVFSAGFSVKY